MMMVMVVATLISRAKSETSVLKRKGSPIIDKETGEQAAKTVREEYVDKNGRTRGTNSEELRWQKLEMLGHFHLELPRKRRMRTMLIP